MWCCGMPSAGGCPGAPLATASKIEHRCLKDRASQGPSFDAHVLPAFLERFGEGKSGGDELLVPVFGLIKVVSRAHSLDYKLGQARKN